MSQFEIALTTPFYSAHTTDAGFYPATQIATGLIAAPNSKVTIPRSNMRAAEISLSIWDPVWDDVRTLWSLDLAYQTFLHVKYRGKPVFWGPIVTPEWDSETETVKLSAWDHGIRMQHHYLRRGDGNIVGSKGTLTFDYVGLRAVRDAAENIASQDTRGVPPLGIIDGINTATAHPNQKFEVTRGDECWSTFLLISQNTFGPDFELEPLNLNAAVPAYYKLNTWDFQGNDKRGKLIFQDSCGVANVRKTTWTPGGKIITHAHVLDSKGWRVTSASDSASGQRGVWVFWDAINQRVPHNSSGELVLKAVGDQLIKAYSQPPDYATLELKKLNELLADRPDGNPAEVEEYHYNEDYGVGDIIRWEVKKGAMQKESDSRIEQVTLQTEDSSGEVRELIDTVPYIYGFSAGTEDS